MDAHAINEAAKDIADGLHREMSAKRITRADIETVRAACVGYLIGSYDYPNRQAHEDLTNAALRKFVEACA